MSPERKFYVYAHFRKSDGRVFYIGKGGEKRPSSKVGRSVRWHRTVNKHGLSIEIVKSDMPEPCSFTLEKILIASIGRDKLCNLTDGGEGTSGRVASKNQRKKCSISNKGTKPAPHSIELARAKNSKPIGTRCGLRFSSATAAAKAIRPENWRAGKTGICASAQGRNKTAFGYEWGYIQNGEPQFLYPDKPKKPDIRPHKWKSIAASNGMKFDAISHAVEWLRSKGRNKARTAAVCRAAKTGGTAYGMRWFYV